MATIEELSNALVKADAAGNTEDAKALADAIREMQAQPQESSQGMAESALQAAAPTIRGAAPYVVGGLTALALAPEAAAAGTAIAGGMGLMALTKLIGDPAVIGVNRLIGANLTTPSEAW